MFSEHFVILLLSATGIIIPVVELIKRIFNLKGVLALILSLGASVIMGIPYGMTNGISGFELITFTITIFAIANGWYKVVHKR